MHLIDVYELLAAFGVTLLAVITAYIKIKIDIRSMAKDVEYMDAMISELKLDLKDEKIKSNETDIKINDKIDSVLSVLNELKLELAKHK